MSLNWGGFALLKEGPISALVSHLAGRWLIELTVDRAGPGHNYTTFPSSRSGCSLQPKEPLFPHSTWNMLTLYWYGLLWDFLLRETEWGRKELLWGVFFSLRSLLYSSSEQIHFKPKGFKNEQEFEAVLQKMGPEGERIYISPKCLHEQRFFKCIWYSGV